MSGVVSLLAPKEPPHNRSAETTVIGSILMQNAGFDVVADVLSADHFYFADLAEMFRIIGATIKAGRKADPMTLMGAFKANPVICPPEDPEAFRRTIGRSLMGARESVLRDAADQIVQCALRRRLGEFGREVSSRSMDDEVTHPSDLISGAQDALHALSVGVEGGRPLATSSEAVDALLRQTEESWKQGAFLSGADCGYMGLNRKVRGFRPGAMYVIGARPGVGKSALGLGLAMRMAKANGRGYIWSGEMPKEELMARAVAAKAGMPVDVVLTGMWDYHDGPRRISDDEMNRIVNAGMEASRIPLAVDDREGVTVQQILTRARRLKREKEGLAFIVVDYIALLRPSAEARRYGSRTAEVTELSADLARMARELSVPVIVLTQLNRQSENREDRRPSLADIRESGAIEQDARCVIAIYREEMALSLRTDANGELVRNLNESDAAYEKRSEEHIRRLEASRGRAELLVLKNRGGKTGTVPMWFDGPTTFFRDVAEDERGYAW